MQVSKHAKSVLRPVMGLELELALQRDVRKTTPNRSSGHPRNEEDGQAAPLQILESRTSIQARWRRKPIADGCGISPRLDVS